MKKETYRILETPGGWLNKHYGITHKTAVAAKKYIERDAKEKVKDRGMIITVIEWETTTKRGTDIVRAITSTEN